jgi:nucleotide-binding universal stress UspA family protein
MMYSKILVPVDGSAPSMLGLQEAIRLAKGCGASLRLVRVVNEFILADAAYVPSVYYERLIEPLREMGRKILEDANATVRQQRLESQTELLETVGGRVADLIVEQAKQWPADLIVMGTHGRRGLSRLALGSDAEMVLRTSPVPVLLVRGTLDAA